MADIHKEMRAGLALIEQGIQGLKTALDKVEGVDGVVSVNVFLNIYADGRSYTHRTLDAARGDRANGSATYRWLGTFRVSVSMKNGVLIYQDLTKVE